MLPIPLKVKESSDWKALGQTVSNDSWREAFTGIYADVERKAYVTTNGDYLFVIPDARITESKLLCPLTGEPFAADVKFPDYSPVLDLEMFEMFFVIDRPQTFLSKLNGILRANRFINNDLVCRLTYQGNESFVKSDLFFKVVQFFVQTGSHKLRVEISEIKPNMLIVRDWFNHSRFCILMCFDNSNEHTRIAHCTVLDAIEYNYCQQTLDSHRSKLNSLQQEITADMWRAYRRMREELRSNFFDADYYAQCKDDLMQACKAHEETISKYRQKVKEIESKMINDMVL